MSIVNFHAHRYAVIHAFGEQIAADVSWDEFKHLADLLNIDKNDFIVDDYVGEKIVTLIKMMSADEIEMAKMWTKVKLFAKRNPEVFAAIRSENTQAALPGTHNPIKSNVLQFQRKSSAA